MIMAIVVDARRAYEPILAEALSLYSAERLAGQPFREGWKGVGHLAHGWYLRCHRGVLALLALDTAGFAEEGSPLRRSIIEHVVALQWLAHEGEGVLDAVARGHARSVESLKDAMRAAQWTSFDLEEADRVIASTEAEDRDRTKDYLLHFKARVGTFGDVHAMAEWLLECSRSHPSFESAVTYFDPSDESLLESPRISVWQVPFATTHVMMALEAVRKVFDPQPWDVEFRVLTERFKNVTDAARAQDGLRPIQWPQVQTDTPA